jgi:peptidoglycan/LPS O-acetylase OafA/YrhL
MVTGLVFYPRIKCGFRATSWTTVAVSRFFRIVPLQLASVMLATAILAAITGNLPNADYPAAFVDWMTGSDEPPLLGYAESGRLNAYVLWSLWYEWLFYLLIMPLCAIGVDMVRGRLPAISVPITLLLVGLSAWALGSPSKALGFLPLFAVGMIACEFQWNARVRRVLCSWQATLAGAVALVLAINISAFPYNFVTLPLLALFFVCVACGNTMGGILKTDGALVLGEISFGTYILHGLVLFGIFGGLAGFMVRLPPGILLMCALPIAGLAVVMLASATHVLIERPGIRAGVVFARILGRSAFPILSPLQSPS